MSELKLPQLGYMSLGQLREHAVQTCASTDEMHSRQLATHAFHSVMREHPDGILHPKEEMHAPVVIRHPEMGNLINLGVLKAVLESGKLMERRPSQSIVFPDRSRPPVLGAKRFGLLSSYIEAREQFLGVESTSRV